jgi:hypothetical protein
MKSAGQVMLTMVLLQAAMLAHVLVGALGLPCPVGA